MLKLSIRTLVISTLLMGSAALAVGVEERHSIEDEAMKKDIIEASKDLKKELPAERLIQATRFINREQIAAAKNVRISDDLLKSPMLDLNGANKDMQDVAKMITLDPVRIKFVKDVVTKAHTTAAADLTDSKKSPEAKAFAKKRLAAQLVYGRNIVMIGANFDPAELAKLDTEKMAQMATVYTGETSEDGKEPDSDIQAMVTQVGFFYHMNLAQAAARIDGHSLGSIEALEKGESNWLQTKGYSPREARKIVNDPDIQNCDGRATNAMAAFGG